MDKIKRLLFITLTFILSACNEQFTKSTTIQSVDSNNPSETIIVDSAKADIKKITNQDVRVFWHNIKGDNVFSVAYVTIYDPQKTPDEFIEEFNKVVLISGEWYAQSSTNSTVMIVLAKPTNASRDKPPLREVVVNKEKVIEWMNGNISKENFVASWFVVSFPNQ